MKKCLICGIIKIYTKGLCQQCFKIKRQNESPKKKCECSDECQEIIPSITHNGKPMRYQKYHHKNFAFRDKKSNWKNGRRRSGPYMKILRKYHKYSDSKGYIWEHRYYMELELGRYLLPEEKIHHIDGDCLNNEIENLMLFPNHSEHIKFEKTIDMSDRQCFLCGSKTSYIRKSNGQFVWFLNDNHFICQKCRDRLRYDLKRKNIWRKKTI